MREAISAAVIRNGYLLLVRKKETWTLPGGKPESGESDIECLSRELKEELRVSLKNPKRLGGRFIGITPHKRDLLCARVYLAEVAGEIIPSAEIEAAEWTRSPEGYRISDITRKIVCFLREKGYL